MPNNEIVGGTFYFFINGQQYKARGDAKYSIAENEKEGVIGLDGVHGFKQKPRLSWLEISLTDQGDLDTKKMAAINDATITGECASGKQVVLSNAWCSMPPEPDVVEGQFTVKFEAPRGEEILVNA